MTQHWMFIIWGYVKGVVALLTVASTATPAGRLRQLQERNGLACRGGRLVVLQHTLPLFDKMA